MNIKGIEHIGIAVRKLEEATPFWRHIMGIPSMGIDVVENQGVTTDIYDTGKGKVELLEALKPNSPISKFLSERGPGIHHVCFEVDGIYSAIKELRESNIKVIDERPAVDADGNIVVFIHPKDTGGVLVELVQKQ